MSYRLNAPQVKVWKRRGYLLTLATGGSPSDIFSVHAEAPRCPGYKLHLIFHRNEIAVVQLLQAPVKPKRLWRELDELRGYKHWADVPAPWLRMTIEQLLKEALENDQERRTA